MVVNAALGRDLGRTAAAFQDRLSPETRARRERSGPRGRREYRAPPPLPLFYNVVTFACGTPSLKHTNIVNRFILT